MRKSEIKTGMKVVPISKSVYSELNMSSMWESAKSIGQDFLFVIDEKYCLSVYKEVIRCAVKNDSRYGDYFLPHDLILYVEVKK